MTSDKLLKFVPFSKTSQWNVKYFFPHSSIRYFR